MMIEEIPTGTLAQVSPVVGRIVERLLESNATANFLIIMLVIIATIPLLAIGLFATRPLAPSQSQPTTPLASEVAFLCAGGKSFSAYLSGNEVRLALSDGRSLLLPEVPDSTAAAGAASGGNGESFANSDDSFVLWFSNVSAYIREAGAMIYSGCVANG